MPQTRLRGQNPAQRLLTIFKRVTMKYFSFEEFSRSDTARKRGIDNSIPPHVRPAIEALVENVLDPLREAWGRPLTITSGYRCEALNKAVGGSKSSHHMRGMAADISTGDRTLNQKLYQLVVRLNLPFTQLIDEKNFAWVHISYDPANLKRQQLKL